MSAAMLADTCKNQSRTLAGREWPAGFTVCQITTALMRTPAEAIRRGTLSHKSQPVVELPRLTPLE